ncbi:MAG TPA: hypothetical protein VF867_19295 [Arthrobacter sp.]
MSILAITVTTVSCDGVHGRACPERSTMVYNHPMSVASRLARQAGWDLDIDAVCPSCVGLGVLSLITSAIPVVQVLRAA